MPAALRWLGHALGSWCTASPCPGQSSLRGGGQMTSRPSKGSQGARTHISDCGTARSSAQREDAKCGSLCHIGACSCSREPHHARRPAGDTDPAFVSRVPRSVFGQRSRLALLAALDELVEKLEAWGNAQIPVFLLVMPLLRVLALLGRARLPWSYRYAALIPLLPLVSISRALWHVSLISASAFLRLTRLDMPFPA